MSVLLSIVFVSSLLTPSLIQASNNTLSEEDEGKNKRSRPGDDNEPKKKAKPTPQLDKLSQDEMQNILQFLDTKSLSNLSQTQEKQSSFTTEYIKSQFNQTFNNHETQNLHHKELFENILKGSDARDYLEGVFKKKMDAQGIVFIDKNAFYAPALQGMLKDYKQVPLFDNEASQFDKIRDSWVYRDIQAYVEKDDVKSDKKRFLIENYIDRENKKKEYIDFRALLQNQDIDDQTLEKLKQAPFNIVVSDEDLNDQGKARLERILETNPNHVVHLDVGKKFVDKGGILSMNSDALPKNLRHLKISNLDGSVTSIGSHFLSGSYHLASHKDHLF